MEVGLANLNSKRCPTFERDADYLLKSLKLWLRMWPHISEKKKVRAFVISYDKHWTHGMEARTCHIIWSTLNTRYGSRNNNSACQNSESTLIDPMTMICGVRKSRKGHVKNLILVLNCIARLELRKEPRILSQGRSQIWSTHSGGITSKRQDLFGQFKFGKHVPILEKPLPNLDPYYYWVWVYSRELKPQSIINISHWGAYQCCFCSMTEISLRRRLSILAVDQVNQYFGT